MTRTLSDPAKRPIRLTYLITDLDRGGVPLHLYRLATRLDPKRFRVQVISLADHGSVATMLQEAGVTVRSCGATSAMDMCALWRLWRLLRADPPDILHALLFHANTAARLIGPLAGIPTNHILCEIQTVERVRRWHGIVDNLTCRLCRYEVGNSPSVVEHLHHWAHIPRSRLSCEWGAVDVETFASAEPIRRTELGLPDNEPMVIWTGRLDPVKGFEEMLAAFKRVCENRLVHLVIVGKGPYLKVIQQLIRNGNLTSRTLLTGERSDIPALLKSADLFLFCSRTEGMPNALLEAMAAGLPIVATDVPGCRDLIVSEKTGLLVPAGSVEAIAKAIQTLLDDPHRRDRLGQAAQAWVKNHANAQSLLHRWECIYEMTFHRQLKR